MNGALIRKKNWDTEIPGLFAQRRTPCERQSSAS